MENNYKFYVKHDDDTVHIFDSTMKKDGNTITLSHRFIKEVPSNEIDEDILKDCEKTGYAER